MSRRILTGVALALLAALLAAVPSGAAIGTPRITEAGGVIFPGRAYVVSLPPGVRVRPNAITVYENGQPVRGLTVTPVSTAKTQQFGAVLVIDSSNSMIGGPERAAYDAARAFAADRKPQQLLGLVTYNVAPTVELPLTTDATKIETALSQQPRFVYGTHIYDAVVSSLDLLKQDKVKAGTIVLLSDGQEARAHSGDTGAHQTEASAAAAARGAHVRIFTVGLHSRFARLGVLKKLASDTGGRYIEAKSLAQLRTIYEQLGSQLASEYLLHYQSLAGPGKQIKVTVHVGDLPVATTGYETPKLAILKPLPAAPYKIPLANKVWTSIITMVLVGFVVAGLIGVGAGAIILSPGKGTVRQRMAEFVSVPSALRDPKRRPTAQVTDKMLKGTHQLLRDATWWQKFRWELEVAAISLPAEQIIILCLIGSVVLLIFLKFLTGWHSAGSILISLVLAALIPVVARQLVKRQLARRRLQFAEQLPDNLQVLSSALRAGHSFIGALSVVVNDAPEPARSEFQRVIADEQLGVPVDQALHVVVERMDNRDLEQVALVAALQHETGGNTAEVLDRVTDTIRERFELRRTVRTLTAQGRMSRWVLTLLPIFLFLIINLINPTYIGILYHTTGGKVLLVLAAIAVTSGSFVIKRIVNIKV
jgi:tight adherence protein B